MFIVEETEYFEGLDELKDAVVELGFKPDEIVEMIFNGNLGNWREDLFYFNGYGNIEHVNPNEIIQ